MIRSIFTLSIVLSLCGCGGVVPTFLRSTASLAVITSGGYRALRSYDEDKQKKVRERAKTDAKGAEQEFNEYTPKRDLVLKVLDSASVGVEGAYAATPVIGQALDKKKRAELGAWIPTLTKFGFDVMQALSTLGIKLPGGAK